MQDLFQLHSHNDSHSHAILCISASSQGFYSKRTRHSTLGEVRQCCTNFRLYSYWLTIHLTPFGTLLLHLSMCSAGSITNAQDISSHRIARVLLKMYIYVIRSQRLNKTIILSLSNATLVRRQPLYQSAYAQRNPINIFNT